MDELIQENKDVDTLPFEDINQILQRALRCCDLWAYKQSILDYISKKLGIPSVVTNDEVITISDCALLLICLYLIICVYKHQSHDPG